MIANDCTGIAKALDCLIFTTKRKRKILECQESSELVASLTDDPNATCLHVVGMGDLTIPVFISCWYHIIQAHYIFVF